MPKFTKSLNTPTSSSSQRVVIKKAFVKSRDIVPSSNETKKPILEKKTNQNISSGVNSEESENCPPDIYLRNINASTNTILKSDRKRCFIKSIDVENKQFENISALSNNKKPSLTKGKPRTPVKPTVLDIRTPLSQIKTQIHISPNVNELTFNDVSLCGNKFTVTADKKHLDVESLNPFIGIIDPISKLSEVDDARTCENRNSEYELDLEDNCELEKNTTLIYEFTEVDNVPSNDEVTENLTQSYECNEIQTMLNIESDAIVIPSPENICLEEISIPLTIERNFEKKSAINRKKNDRRNSLSFKKRESKRIKAKFNLVSRDSIILTKLDHHANISPHLGFQQDLNCQNIKEDSLGYSNEIISPMRKRIVKPRKVSLNLIIPKRFKLAESEQHIKISNTSLTLGCDDNDKVKNINAIDKYPKIRNGCITFELKIRDDFLKDSLRNFIGALTSPSKEVINVDNHVCSSDAMAISVHEDCSVNTSSMLPTTEIRLNGNILLSSEENSECTNECDGFEAKEEANDDVGVHVYVDESTTVTVFPFEISTVINLINDNVNDNDITSILDLQDVKEEDKSCVEVISSPKVTTDLEVQVFGCKSNNAVDEDVNATTQYSPKRNEKVVDPELFPVNYRRFSDLPPSIQQQNEEEVIGCNLKTVINEKQNSTTRNEKVIDTEMFPANYRRFSDILPTSQLQRDDEVFGCNLKTVARESAQQLDQYSPIRDRKMVNSELFPVNYRRFSDIPQPIDNEENASFGCNLKNVTMENKNHNSQIRDGKGEYYRRFSDIPPSNEYTNFNHQSNEMLPSLKSEDKCEIQTYNSNPQVKISLENNISLTSDEINSHDNMIEAIDLNIITSNDFRRNPSLSEVEVVLDIETSLITPSLVESPKNCDDVALKTLSLDDSFSGQNSQTNENISPTNSPISRNSTYLKEEESFYSHSKSIEEIEMIEIENTENDDSKFSNSISPQKTAIFTGDTFSSPMSDKSCWKYSSTSEAGAEIPAGVETGVNLDDFWNVDFATPVPSPVPVSVVVVTVEGLNTDITCLENLEIIEDLNVIDANNLFEIKEEKDVNCLCHLNEESFVTSELKVVKSVEFQTFEIPRESEEEAELGDEDDTDVVNSASCFPFLFRFGKNKAKTNKPSRPHNSWNCLP